MLILLNELIVPVEINATLFLSLHHNKFSAKLSFAPKNHAGI